ncbi:MAG: hypothetical protein AB7H77_02030 [Bdellovibrionales bacterium]
MNSHALNLVDNTRPADDGPWSQMASGLSSNASVQRINHHPDKAVSLIFDPGSIPSGLPKGSVAAHYIGEALIALTTTGHEKSNGFAVLQHFDATGRELLGTSRIARQDNFGPIEVTHANASGEVIGNTIRKSPEKRRGLFRAPAGGQADAFVYQHTGLLTVAYRSAANVYDRAMKPLVYTFA